MSVQTQIDRINGAKTKLVTACGNLDIALASGAKIDAIAQAILNYSTSGGGGTYTTTFSNTTTVTISASTHKMGTTPWVDVYILSGSTYIKTHSYPSSGYKISVDSSGNITITFGTSTSGRVKVGK